MSFCYDVGMDMSVLTYWGLWGLILFCLGDRKDLESIMNWVVFSKSGYEVVGIVKGLLNVW